MSIPLVRNNTKDAINTSIIAIKKNLERINSILGLMDSSEPDLSGLATKQELEDAVTEINNTIDEVETSLQPVDTVTSGDMHSVTSNAVAGVISPINQMLNQLYNINDLSWVYRLPFIAWGDLPSQSTDDSIYFKEWFDYLYDNHYFDQGYRAFIGLANPNMNVMVLGYTYGGTIAKLWSAFIYFHPNVGLKRFGYRDGVWYCDTLIA